MNGLPSGHATEHDAGTSPHTSPGAPAPWLPETCDLFPEWEDEEIEKHRAKGRRPSWVKVRQHKEGKTVSLQGTWAVEETSEEWLLRTYGEGTYTIYLMDQGHAFIKQARLTVEARAVPTHHGVPHYPPPPSHAPHGSPPHGAPGHPGAPPPPYYTYPYHYPPPPPPPTSDPFMASIKELAALMTLQMQADTARLKQQLELRQSERPDTALMTTLIEAVTKPKAAGAVGAASSLDDIGKLIGLGVAISKMARGGAPGDEGSWMKDLIPTVVETMGPGLVGIVAQLLPPEQARHVMGLMEQHLAALNDPAPDVTGESA